MAVGFLFISPALRGSVMGVLTETVQGLEHYSPISYVALGALCLGGFMASLRRGSAPR